MWYFYLFLCPKRSASALFLAARGRKERKMHWFEPKCCAACLARPRVEYWIFSWLLFCRDELINIARPVIFIPSSAHSRDDRRYSLRGNIENRHGRSEKRQHNVLSVCLHFRSWARANGLRSRSRGKSFCFSALGRRKNCAESFILLIGVSAALFRIAFRLGHDERTSARIDWNNWNARGTSELRTEINWSRTSISQLHFSRLYSLLLLDGIVFDCRLVTVMQIFDSLIA